MTTGLDRQRVPRILADDGPATWDALHLLATACDADVEGCERPLDAFQRCQTALEHDGAAAGLIAAHSVATAALVALSDEAKDDPLVAMRADDQAQSLGTFLALAVAAGKVAAAERASIDPQLWTDLLDDAGAERAATLTANAVARSVAGYRTGDADTKAFPRRSLVVETRGRADAKAWNRDEQETMRLAAVADRWANEHGAADHPNFPVLGAYRGIAPGPIERLQGTVRDQPVLIVQHAPIAVGDTGDGKGSMAQGTASVPLFLAPEVDPRSIAVPQDSGRTNRGKRKTARTPAGRIGQAVEVECHAKNGAAVWVSPGRARGRVIVPSATLTKHLEHGDRLTTTGRSITLPTYAGGTILLGETRQAVRTTYRGWTWTGHALTGRPDDEHQSATLTATVLRSRRTKGAESRANRGPTAPFDGIDATAAAALSVALKRMADRLGSQARLAVATMRPLATSTGGARYLVNPHDDGSVTILHDAGETTGAPSTAAREAVKVALGIA